MFTCLDIDTLEFSVVPVLNYFFMEFTAMCMLFDITVMNISWRWNGTATLRLKNYSCNVLITLIWTYLISTGIAHVIKVLLIV